MSTSTNRTTGDVDSAAPLAHRRWYHNGTLPHFDNEGITQAITFRLVDSLPREVIERLACEAKELHPDDMDAEAAERHRRIERFLDASMGSCTLRDCAHARIVRDALGHFHGHRYDLLAWVVMPNHVHVLIKQRASHRLAAIVQSWKIFTAKQINGGGRLWQRDYWDCYIRDEAHFARCLEYIHQNPVKAGLVKRAEDWPWSSAGASMSTSTVINAKNGDVDIAAPSHP